MRSDVSYAQAKAIDIAAEHTLALLDRCASPPCRRVSQTGEALSERIGTALINGSWFVRRLQRLANHAVVMHGHRHIDWIGECGGLLIVSAPSPVMAATDDRDTYFYVHTLAVGTDGKLRLLERTVSTYLDGKLPMIHWRLKPRANSCEKI